MNTPEQTIGHYQLKNLLGAGGMGNVFLGYDPRLERQVAIKCVRIDTNIENGDSYLKKEARVLAKLNHPNIVQLYDIVEQESQLALVMEYVKGTSFKDVIKNQDYTLKQALTWLSEVSLGLHSAHHHNIIHRDLKPENILLSDENKAKIADFGIAKLTNAEHHSTHNILGSYIAFSPEQAGGKKLDCQTDVFSLGIFAYLLLCRKHPFGDSSEPANIITNILSGGVVPPERENSNIAKPISDLVIALLEKKPENRPHSLQEVSQIFLDHASQHNQTKIFNVITTDTVIEKKDTSKNHTRVLSSQHSNFTRVVTTSIKNRFFLYSSITFAVFLTAVIIFALYPRDIENQYIAVMEPKLSSQLSLEKEDYLVKSTIFNAFEQSVTNTSGLKLIPRLELSDAGNTPSQVGTRTGADSVLSSHIECFNRSCNITLSRLGSGDWSVIEQKQWSVIKDQFLNTYNISAQRAGILFSDTQDIKQVDGFIDEETYKEYIETQHDLESTANAPQKSLQEISKLIKKAPNYPPLYNLFTNVALHAYDRSKEIRYLNMLEEKLQDVPSKLSSTESFISNWFELYLAKGNYPLAQEQILRMQSNAENEIEAIQMRAILALAENNFDLAIKHFEHVLLYRKSRKALYQLALAYWQQGNLVETLHQVNAILDLSPNDYYGLSFKAAIALSQGDLVQAKQAYENLLVVSDDSSHYTNLGLVYMLLKEYDDAKLAFVTSLKKNPQNFTFQINLADIEQITGNRDIAKASYLNIIESLVSPTELEEMLVLTQAHAQLGNYEKAIASLQKLVEQSPENPNTAFTAALTYTLASEYTSATVNITKAIKLGMSPIWFTLPWFTPLCEKIRLDKYIGVDNKNNLCMDSDKTTKNVTIIK